MAKMNILTALAFGLLINGCTIIGMHLDEVTQSKNNIDADAAFTELGLDIDIQLIKHATTGKSLLTKDKPTGCNNLKGKRKE
jgi:hypothetical protein